VHGRSPDPLSEAPGGRGIAQLDRIVDAVRESKGERAVGPRAIRAQKEGSMAAGITIEEYLEDRKIPFSVFMHRPAFTAQEEAAITHVPGRSWAKTVVCIADNEPVLVVLPAPYIIDFDRLRQLVGTHSIGLATEDEMAGLYPGCEVGSMPPLGPLYNQRVFVDTSLVSDPELVFDAGAHTKAYRMHYSDFAELVKPVVGSFGRLPEQGTTPQRTRRRWTPIF
jgi:Ala-tRNA(Pro) deacylase